MMPVYIIRPNVGMVQKNTTTHPHTLPCTSSTARRRPTPSPEGPPWPSSFPLQKAQVRYMPAGAGSRERYLAVQRTVPLPAPRSLSLCESIHAERADVDVGNSA